MKSLIKRYLPPHTLAWLREAKANITGAYAVSSYSQEGEDMILARLFDCNKRGFYVDVGAHHPKRFSNTYFFYRRGWRGINIEPNPEALALFHAHRKGDINLSFGVSDNECKLRYFMFNEPALNSFDQELSERRQSETYKITGTRTIKVRPLSAILDQFLPTGTHINFLTIDVEGYDLRVLNSNDWSRYRPECVVVEAANFDLAAVTLEPVDKFLSQRNYRLVAKTFNTLFYLDKTAIDSLREQERQ